MLFQHTSVSGNRYVGAIPPFNAPEPTGIGGPTQDFSPKRDGIFAFLATAISLRFLATAISLTTNKCSSTSSVSNLGCSFLGVLKRWSPPDGHLRQTERKLQTKLEGAHLFFTNACKNGTEK